MKTVRVKNGLVQEIIPDYATPPEKWYGEAFASHCVNAPDEVEQNWIYNSETGEFFPPAPHPDPEPTQIDRVEAQATYTAMMTDTLLGG